MLVMLNISILCSLLFSISLLCSSFVIGQKFLLFAINLLINLLAVKWGEGWCLPKKYYSENSFTAVILKYVSNLPHKRVLWRLFNAPFTVASVAQHWPGRRREQWSRQQNMVAHLYCIPVDWLAPDCSGNTDELQSKGTFKILKNISWDKKFCRLWWNMTEWISSLQLSHPSSSMCSVRETPSWPEFSLSSDTECSKKMLKII